MTKPERTVWATDTNYAAGADPWSGQPNKVAPSSSRIATGYIPKNRPPAPEFNWWRNRCAEWFATVAKMQLRSWMPTDVSGALNLGAMAGGTFEVMDCVYSPGSDIWVVANEYGYGFSASRNGYEWFDDSGGTTLRSLFTGAGVTRFTSLGLDASLASPNYEAFLAGNDSGLIKDLIFKRTAASPLYSPTWAQLTPATTGSDWNDVAHSRGAGNGILVCVGDSGVCDFSTNLGTLFTAATTSLLGNLLFVEHSHDSSNPLFLTSNTAGTATVYTSTDGNNWTANTAGVGWTTGAFTPIDAAYDTQSGRWIIIGQQTAGDAWYSDDNGVNWAQLAGVVPAVSGQTKRICCDGRGGWLVTGGAGTTAFNAMAWYSVDNGITWEKADTLSHHEAGVACDAGDGYFVSVGDTNIYRSLLG